MYYQSVLLEGGGGKKELGMMSNLRIDFSCYRRAKPQTVSPFIHWKYVKTLVSVNTGDDELVCC